METATQAQITYLTKLQAEYLADQADGFFTQHATLEEHIAAVNWENILPSERARFTAQIDRTPKPYKLTPAEEAREAAYLVWEPEAKQAREMIAQGQAEGLSYMAAYRKAEEALLPKVDARVQARHWEAAKARDEAAHADLTDLSKAEASRLIGLLK